VPSIQGTVDAMTPARKRVESVMLLAISLVCVACSTTKAPLAKTATTSAPGTSVTGSASGAAGSTSGGQAAGSCTLPLTHDAFDGFHIGVPNGWDLFTHNGTIVVSKDPSKNTEESNVTPVLMTPGLTPASVFSSSLGGLQKQLAALGATMTDTITSSGDQPPAASLTLQAGQVSLAGQARLVVLPEVTSRGSSVAALLASWAPTSSFAGESGALAAIGACYGPEPGTLYQVVKDQVFTYAIPVGWTVKSEDQDSIEVDDGNDASASYLLTMLPPGTGVDSPQSLLAYVFGHLGIHIDKQLSSLQSPNQQLANGGTQGQVRVEFTGTLKDGRAVHGSVDVVSVTGGSTPSGVIRLGVATPELWNSVNGALTHVKESIQHAFTQDLLQWEQLSRQQQAFSQQVQGFDYALNGVDLVHDPATGATFEAPYDTYRATGQDGPGYYDPAGNRLQIETP
jgi:hypothetical protein